MALKEWSGGVKNGPPYPIDRDKNSTNHKKRDNIKSVKLAKEKFTEYALNPEKAPDKANAFKLALGYTKDDADDLIENINNNFDIKKLEERGDNGYGMRYQQIMRLKGPNNKEANVLTAWIQDGETIKLTSAYITKKEISE